MHSRAQFFFLLRRRVGTIFPIYSHQVPTGFPTCFNGTLLYPLSFAFSSDLVTKITRSKQGHYSISALGMSHLLHFISFYDGPTNDANYQKKKELWGSSQPGT
jgi:hypothetical protein